jgi:hypothetical protein
MQRLVWNLVEARPFDEAGRELLLHDENETMTTVFHSMAAGIGLGAMASAGPVQAYSVQSFFDENHETISENAQAGGLLLAFSTEAYRSQQAGNPARAACIVQALIPRGWEGAPYFDRMMDEMRESHNKAKESVESYVVGAIESYCPVSGAAKFDPSPFGISPSLRLEPTSVKTFYDRFKSGQDKFDALSLAISTQALRVMNAGNEARGQCILDNLTIGRVNGEQVLPFGLQTLARKLGKLRDSFDSVEGNLMEAIVLNCGAEEDKTRP